MAFTWTPEDGTLAAADDAARSARYASPRNWIISGMSLSAGTGLNVAVSAGSAWIAGYYVEWDAATEQAVAALNTNHVFAELTRDMAGNVTAVAFVVNTTGTPPSGDFVKLGTATTDGSGVTGTATTGRSPQNQGVTSVFGRDGAVVAAASDYDADQVDYDNTVSGLTASDVQAAVDELAARPMSAGWDGVTGASADLSKNNTTFTSFLSFTAVANKTYIIDADITIVGGSGGSNMQIIVPSGGSADFSIVSVQTQGSMLAASAKTFVDIGASSSQNLEIATSRFGMIKVTGIVVINATAGTVAIQVAQQSASGTTVFKAGSNLKWKDVT